MSQSTEPSTIWLTQDAHDKLQQGLITAEELLRLLGPQDFQG